MQLKRKNVNGLKWVLRGFLAFSGSKVISKRAEKMILVAVKKDGAGKTPPETKRKRKHSEERKGAKTQNLADERRITGRFAKRFSGERPVSLGLQS